MNERIQELKNQCWVEKHWDKENERWIDRHVDLEKFAELIVRECVGIVNSLEQYEGQGDCSTAEYIKEHFGVEE